jgi:hypothetical protein
MTLAALQHGFLAEIASDDSVPPRSVGMAIYRNAYRGRLSEALGSGFERTRTWVGEAAFEQAAAHYILSHPPHRWTLDLFGSSFPALLEELFADDPEVGELAWLEWHLQQAFAAPDRPVLTAPALAAAELSEQDWADLRFDLAAGFAARPASFDTIGLWQQLREGGPAEPPAPLPQPGHLIVWRNDYAPHYRLVASDEWKALGALAQGQPFGTVAAMIGEARLPQFGEWFAAWLSDGLLSELHRKPA